MTVIDRALYCTFSFAIEWRSATNESGLNIQKPSDGLKVKRERSD